MVIVFLILVWLTIPKRKTSPPLFPKSYFVVRINLEAGHSLLTSILTYQVPSSHLVLFVFWTHLDVFIFLCKVICTHTWFDTIMNHSIFSSLQGAERFTNHAALGIPFFEWSFWDFHSILFHGLLLLMCGFFHACVCLLLVLVVYESLSIGASPRFRRFLRYCLSSNSSYSSFEKPYFHVIRGRCH